jgi:hypothetical protein
MTTALRLYGKVYQQVLSGDIKAIGHNRAREYGYASPAVLW